MAGNIKDILSEILGVFAIVFIGAAAVCMDAWSGGKIGLPAVALAHGLSLAAILWLYGSRSMGHFNPAITIAWLTVGHVDILKAFFLVAAQLLGASLAGICIKALPNNTLDVAASAPQLTFYALHGLGYRGATLLEAIGTFFLASAYFAGWSGKNQGTSSCWAVGCIAAACTLAFGPLTGAALNPARVFGPAVASGQWAQWYVYWIGPLSGAWVAARVHEAFYAEKKER
ncbi:MAG: aquaporin [Elusimicrobia bacterium]|nr:aquaporin [Elusimicrobiota bacterium]